MRKLIFAIPLLAICAYLPSCSLDSEEDKKKEEEQKQWKIENDAFFKEAQEAVDEAGNPVYQKVSPVWAPSIFVLMKWHNNPAATAKNLKPLDNSTCNIKYALRLIDKTEVQDSYSSTTYGDSIFQCRPNNMIPGMWIALTSMHVGDSVTLIIPQAAAYGETASALVPAYSTLIYDVKLKDIPFYEIP